MLADGANANNEAAARPRRARASLIRTALARAAVAPFLTLIGLKKFAFLISPPCVFQHLHHHGCIGIGAGFWHAPCRGGGGVNSRPCLQV